MVVDLAIEKFLDSSYLIRERIYQEGPMAQEVDNHTLQEGGEPSDAQEAETLYLREMNKIYSMKVGATSSSIRLSAASWI